MKYIVIDELHHWRGVVGAHISLVIRRLLRIAHHLGADPIIIMLSATIRDPEAVGQAMTGRPCIGVTHDGSPASDHQLFLWQGRLVPDEAEVDMSAFLKAVAGEETVLEAPMRRVSAQTEAASLTAAMIEKGASLLTFIRSRAGAESVAAQVRNSLSSHGSPLAGRVAAYRGGFLPEERRALESALRSGRLRAVATTSALELGLDISGLNATVTAGWPGTRASLWQQIGRAGRAGEAGVSVLVASDNPMDEYLVHHPDQIFAPVEANVIDATNPWVLAPHLCAAASEIPLSPERTDSEDLALFGASFPLLARQLADEGYLRERPTGWYWDATRQERPADLTDLRGGAGDVQIIDARTGAVIGTMDAGSADAHLFADAIYVHQGRTYHVVEYSPMTSAAPAKEARSGGGVPRERSAGALAQPASDSFGGQPDAGTSSARPRPISYIAPPAPEEKQRIALVEEVRTPLRTRAKQRVSVSITSVDDTWTSDDGLVTWSFGSVDVSTRVTDYDLLRLPRLEFIRNIELQLPTHTLPTKAVWYELSPAAQVQLRELGIGNEDLSGTLHAAEHTSIGLLPLLATCDRWDLGGLSTAEHDDTGLPTVFVHDAFRGGAGYASAGFENAGEWMRMVLSTLESCDCEDGCPRCVQSPKCGNGNEPLSKAGAIVLTRFLAERAPGA